MADVKKQKGFTLIELLVVSAIVIVITGLVLANNNKFGGKVLLQNLAYDIALTIRQAQVYGIAVRNYQSGNFNIAYGIHFGASPSSPECTSATLANQKYCLFADAHSPPDGLYESSSPDEIVGQPFVISRSYYIFALCKTPIGQAESCSTTLGSASVDIVFKRPDPDACIAAGINGDSLPTFNASGKCSLGSPLQNMQRAKIVVASPRGDKMCVVVEATGQVAVENGNGSATYCP